MNESFLVKKGFYYIPFIRLKPWMGWVLLGGFEMESLLKTFFFLIGGGGGVCALVTHSRNFLLDPHYTKELVG
jgi:hypothetical protein